MVVFIHENACENIGYSVKASRNVLIDTDDNISASTITSTNCPVLQCCRQVLNWPQAINQTGMDINPANNIGKFEKISIFH